MSRGLSLIALLLLAIVSFGLYQLSYEVQRLEDELIEMNRALSQERETIGVLQAEWSYLSRPEYLQSKAQRLLEMRSSTAKDIVDLGVLPWRQDRGQPMTGPAATQPQKPALPPMAAAPAQPQAMPAATQQMQAQPAPSVQVAAKPQAEVPASGFDSEVAAVLGAMQRGTGKETRRAQ